MTDKKDEPKHEAAKPQPAAQTPQPAQPAAQSDRQGVLHPDARRDVPPGMHPSGQPIVDEPPGKYGHQGRPLGVIDPPVPDYAPGTNPPGTNPPVVPDHDPAVTPVPGSLPSDAPERHGGGYPSQGELEQHGVPPSEKPSDQVGRDERADKAEHDKRKK